MKHLKTFEKKSKRKLKEGDYVVLLKSDDENIALKMDFEIGKIYVISHVDGDDFDDLPYRISYIEDITDFDKLMRSAWVDEFMIRLAEPWEINQNKYNL